jgi:hypothetical protein
MRFLRMLARNWRFSLPVLGVLLIALLLAIDYYRPKTHEVIITRTERLYEEGGGWRVNYVPILDGVRRDDEADQFVNQDDLFPYLKRNSGRIDAQINAMPQGTVSYVRVFQWRNEWFSWFPNILSVTPKMAPVQG